MGPERELLRLMTKDRDWIGRVREHLSPEDFVDMGYRGAFEALLADPRLTHVPQGLSSASARTLEELLADPKELRRARRVFEESLSKIRIIALRGRLDEVDRLMQNTTDPQRRMKLLAEKARLGEQWRELGLDWSPTARRTLKGKG